MAEMKSMEAFTEVFYYCHRSIFLRNDFILKPPPPRSIFGYVSPVFEDPVSTL